MPVRRRGNKLERWEIALIKAMVADGRWPNDQDILAYFTRPMRSINHRAISEIRNGAKHTTVKSAAADELEGFIAAWPEVDAETGLSLRGDELLIKAREAMIAAVHTFNSAGLTFRAELFTVTAIIAWTYLLHAWFKREGIDYRHTKNQGGERVVVKTPSGADKYWELSQCLKHANCPVARGARDNLTFLLELRHEIEHRSTGRIDETVSAKLQACCINFNDAIKGSFGAQYALERRLPIALQFVTFSPDQRALLKKAGTLPRHVETMMDTFEGHLTPEQQADPRFAFRVFMVHKTANRAPGADLAVELVPPGSDIAEKFNLALREVEKRKYLPACPSPSVTGMLFPAHSAPTGLIFYEGARFPADYKGNAFVSLHGSWNTSEPHGYKVVRIRMKNGRVADHGFENFLTGFWDGESKNPPKVWGRPVGLAVAKDGSLLVADDLGNVVWRVTYEGKSR